jgi:zinc transport system substrate-binding protein
VKKILPLLLALCLLAGCGPSEQTQAPAGEPEKLRIVATVFPAYDFARSAAGELAEVTLLLPPGMESHSYEPTPADILAVQECDLFLCLGGESDAWVDTILSAVEPKGRILRMMDCVELLEETVVDGMQTMPGHDHSHEEEEDHDHGSEGLGAVMEMDEHVWTSPRNAAAVTRAVGEALAEIDGAHADAYRSGAAAYAGELEDLDRRFETFFAQADHPVMVFGDRFPLRYFVERYGVEYYAAFPGCSTQTEPSAATVAFLTEKVEREQIGTIWYIEFSNHLVADSIAEAAGARTAMFHTCHNVSKAEMDGGATYLSLMEGNLERLQAAFS